MFSSLSIYYSESNSSSTSPADRSFLSSGLVTHCYVFLETFDRDTLLLRQLYLEEKEDLRKEFPYVLTWFLLNGPLSFHFRLKDSTHHTSGPRRALRRSETCESSLRITGPSPQGFSCTPRPGSRPGSSVSD